MPMYRFQCLSCGLEFKKNCSPGTKASSCESCGDNAGVCLPKNINAAVRGDVNGIAPPSTGISGVDYSYDRVIGEDAANKWGIISDRQKDKIELIKSNGVTGYDITKKPDNTYGILKPGEGAKIKKVRDFNMKIISYVNKLRKENG